MLVRRYSMSYINKIIIDGRTTGGSLVLHLVSYVKVLVRRYSMSYINKITIGGRTTGGSPVEEGMIILEKRLARGVRCVRHIL